MTSAVRSCATIGSHFRLAGFDEVRATLIAAAPSRGLPGDAPGNRFALERHFEGQVDLGRAAKLCFLHSHDQAALGANQGFADLSSANLHRAAHLVELEFLKLE